MKKLCLLLSFFIFSAGMCADTIKSAEEMKNLSDNSMNFMARAEFDKAFAVMKPFWPIPDNEINSLTYQVQNQIQMVSQRFGELKGYEFIKDGYIGKSFYRRLYLQKFKNHAIRWMFVFYKADDYWVVNSISFDDQVALMFE